MTEPPGNTVTLDVTSLLAPFLAPLLDENGTALLPVEPGSSIASVLDTLEATHPKFTQRVRDETGAIRRHVNVFLDGRNIKKYDGVATVIAPGQEILVIQSVSGG